MKIRVPILGLSAVLVAAVLACSSAEETLQRHLERAESYVEAGQADRALLELRSALKLAPQNADTNLRIAELLETNEQYDEALFYFEEAHRLDPRSDAAALGLGRLIRFNDAPRADALINEVLERNPGNAMAHVLRSDVQLVRIDTSGALASALTAAELDAKSPRVALQVAMVRKAVIAERRQKGEPDRSADFEAADAAFARAIELSKSEPYWMVRAAIERARLLVSWRGYGPEQVSIYQAAHDAVKDDSNLARRIAEAAAGHARQAKDEEFLHWALSRYLEANPHGYDYWLELAELETKRGGDGLGVLRRMVEQLPDDPQVHITYADQLNSAGRHEEAVAHLEKQIPTSTAPAALLTALVQIHLTKGELSEAHDALDKLRAEHDGTSAADQAEVNVANAEGRLGDALAALERWTGREEDVTAFALLGDARLRAGNPRAALDAIDRALALKEQARPDLQRLRGRILVRLGEHRSALQAFSRARTTGGPLPVAYLSDLALALYAVGRPDEARDALARAMESPQPPPEALFLFAREEGKRDPKAARAALERGAELYPQTIQFAVGLVNTDFREKKAEQAEARARATAASFPDNPNAQTLLVQTLVTRGRSEEAVAEIEKIQERWPGQPGVAELYLSVMTFAGKGDEAFQALSRKQEAGQLPATGRVLLARLHDVRGEDEKAIELLRSALRDQPDLPAAANDLAYALARRGEDLQEATELAQEARASRPDSPEIADTLGFVYMRRNLAEAALVQFDAALELSPPESSAWATAQYHRALALRALGRQEEAVAAVEQALASGADFAEVKEAHKVLAELAGSPAAASGAREGS